MSFSTNIFIFYFFPISLLLSIIVNRVFYQYTKIVLLLISYIFCFWLGKTTIVYVLLVSLLLYLYSQCNKNKLFLYIFIILIVLIFFKFVSIADIDNYYIDKIISLQPIAISFVSLSAISFCIDFYRNDNYKVSLIDISLYISYFPKYISGPIVLWDEFKEKINHIDITLNNIVDGLVVFIKGFFYKVVIADVLFCSIQPIISHYSDHNSLVLILTIFVYSFVIYFDFLGYSVMATGISKSFGIELSSNFNMPYTSHSISEFYRRWHISLGNFFKKYVYIPLGGNKKNVYFNLFIVMLLSGIWHGNGIAYVLWGILTGLLMVIEKKYPCKKKRINIVVNYIIVSILWLPFMLGSTKNIINYIFCIFTNYHSSSLYGAEYYYNIRTILIMVFAIILSFSNLNRIEEQIKKIPVLYYVIFVFIFVVCIMFMINSTYTPFIYFRF